MDADLSLIHRMRNGDKAAIEAFVRKYYPAILRYCCYHTSDSRQAEDLTQEAFYRFFKSFNEYSHRGKLANYLYVIAGNPKRCFQRPAERQLRAEKSFLSAGSENWKPHYIMRMQTAGVHYWIILRQSL